ncbi:aminoacyl-tRNA hydrolase [Patescibacteria group bacterium]|nr:aminoacyl-tRNA hydrolase [Patescibacteria group bacterium]
MKIIIGLGNPEQKFENTPHNLGFMAIDAFAKKNDFLDFKTQKKFDSLVSEKGSGAEKILLVKPQTFMNESGKAVKKAVFNYKLPVADLIIIHDDIDLSMGKIRIVKNSGSGGHKGVESIIKELGKKDFIRIKLGILPEAGKPKNPEKFVIKKFEEKNKTIVEGMIRKTLGAIDCLIKDGLEKTMNEYNK